MMTLLFLLARPAAFTAEPITNAREMLEHWRTLPPDELKKIDLEDLQYGTVFLFLHSSGL